MPDETAAERPDPARLAEAEGLLRGALGVVPAAAAAVVRKSDLRALLAEYERRGAALASVLTALNAGPDEDPVRAAGFVRQAADAFATRTAPVEIKAQRLTDQRDAALAAVNALAADADGWAPEPRDAMHDHATAIREALGVTDD